MIVELCYAVTEMLLYLHCRQMAHILRMEHSGTVCFIQQKCPSRARAIPLWAVLKTLGSSGVENLVDTLCGHTEYFAEQLKKVGYTLVNPPDF